MVELVVDHDPQDADREVIYKGLKAFNKRQLPDDLPAQYVSFLLKEADTGQTLGGLLTKVSANWLHIDLIFVPEQLRGEDWGTKLMQAAEAHALRLKLTGIWLKTYSFQARGFYEKMGYCVFGELKDFPPGNTNVFLNKYLPVDND